jgi:hypothetical protein
MITHVMNDYRRYVLGCLARRMLEFGYEDTVNELTPVDLRELAVMMPASSAALLAEADQKERHVRRLCDPQRHAETALPVR